VLRAYRAAGADPPFGDPARGHGTPFEGYYWRIVQPATGRVVVALCGVCRGGPAGRWALVTLAAHPGGFVRSALTERAVMRFDDFGVQAGPALEGSRTRIAVDLGAGAALDVSLVDPVPFPRGAFGALGPAHLVPGLSQYWHPVVLAAGVRGFARLGGETVDLDGATAYAEKNWGAAFPGRWWWGQAGAFDAGDVTAAFAGGAIRLAGATVAPTTVVVRLGSEVLRMTPPRGRSRVAFGGGAWHVRARAPGVSIELEGDASGNPPHHLDVPLPGEPRTEPRSRQHLAGRIALTVRRRGRTVFTGESPLAGLELGGPAGG
jgi:hypothetical protein